MRWAALFADLEAQAELLAQTERSGEIDERTRAEVGTLRLRDRAGAALGTPVRVRASGGVTATGDLAGVGPDWLLVDEGGGREIVVASAHLLSLRGLGRYSAVPHTEGHVESRLGLRHALRGMARDRSPVRMTLVDGSVLDATVDRIGADFVEVATHSAGEVRRRQDVRAVELVPIAAISAVRRSV